MAWVLVRHRALDYTQFKTVFVEGLERLKESGCTAAYIMRDVDDPDVISVAREWKGLAEAQAFFALEEAEHSESADRAGVLGEMQVFSMEVLEEMNLAGG